MKKLTKITCPQIVTVLLLSLSILPRMQAQAERPNIIWIVSEDNSKHYMAHFEEGGAHMPAIEGLAKEGVTFNHAFSNAPVCSVARSTIITGSYAPRIGAHYHRKMKPAPMPEGLSMFPTYLREAGYYTTNNSKEDYNLIKNEGVWDESSKKASYRNRKAGQPFFHVQNFGTTHEGKLHFNQEMMESRSTKTSLESPLFPIHPDTEIFRYSNAYYRDLHMKVDAEIGEYITMLKGDGLLENTIIFYYGDHGGILPGSKGYLYERGLHVPMVVYFPEKWKHLIPFEKGTRTDAFVEFVDLAPTVLNLAGIIPPENIDGIAFLGENATSQKLEERNTTFGYGDRFDEKYDLVRSLRKGKYKYIRNYQPFNIDGLFNFYRYKMLAYQEWAQLFEDGKLNDAQSQFFLPKQAEALYDLEKDPHETNNLAGEEVSEEILRSLRQEMQEHLRSLPDLGFYPESYFVTDILSNPTKFGQEHKGEIAELLAVADLQVLPFKKAKRKLKKALKSKDPIKRYWGLIVCSSFGEEAAAFQQLARQISENDTEGLNQIRAMEFLSLTNQEIDQELMKKIILNSASETECNLMLNTVALLKTVKSDFNIDLPKTSFNPEWVDKPNDLVNRRVDFINQN